MRVSTTVIKMSRYCHPVSEYFLFNMINTTSSITMNDACGYVQSQDADGCNNLVFRSHFH